MIGRTNAQISGASRVAGGEVIVSHSAGTGGMTDHGVVTLQDGEYRLLEVKQSGMLTFEEGQVEQGILADVCVVNAGCGGGNWGNVGGPGGKLQNFYRIALDNMTVVVGAGGAPNNGVGGTSSFTMLSAPESIYMPSGYGTGAGDTRASGDGGPNTTFYGDGLPKFPFANTSYFDKHCGGGGAGGQYDSVSTYRRSGGKGGTNGGNGSMATTGGSSGGAAGDSSAGAGAGGTSSGTPPNGENAKYYGGGGGGAGVRTTDGNDANGTGGSGYQGVIWIRIPA